MLIQITHKEGRVLIGDRMVLTMSGEFFPHEPSCEVHFATGEKGQIRSPAPFFDCPPYELRLNDQTMGELRMTHPEQPDGRLTLGHAHHRVESRGPWTLLMTDDAETARLTPAWRDSQIGLGVVAEVRFAEECGDWALAALVFAWMTAEAKAKVIAAASLASMIIIAPST